MFSRSSIFRFTPWSFALKTVIKAHQTFAWPAPESACKILFDTPDMPPRLKLVIYSMLRSRQLLLCIVSSSSTPSRNSPLTTTLRAYTSALEAADRVYATTTSAGTTTTASSQFDRHKFPTIGSLDASEWFGSSNYNSSSSSSSSPSSSSRVEIWKPVPATQSKKLASRTQLLLQPRTCPEYANTTTADEHTTKMINNKKRSSKFLPQEKVQPLKQHGHKVFSSPSVYRVRFADAPSLVAEVWSNIQSDGIFNIVSDQICNSSKKKNGLNDSEDQQILCAASHLLSTLLSSRDHLLFNRETLDQVTTSALELLSVLSATMTTKQIVRSNDIQDVNVDEKVAAFEEVKDEEEDEAGVVEGNAESKPTTQANVAFAYCELAANLSSSLRMRGGANAKMTEHLLRAHHLSVSEARFQNVARFAVIPNSRDLVLPMKITFELSQILLVSSSSSSSSSSTCNTTSWSSSGPVLFPTLVDSFFFDALNVIKQEETALLERRRKIFEDKLEEISQVAEALEKNPNNKELHLSRAKREQHLKDVVTRDKEIAVNVSKAIENEVVKTANFLFSHPSFRSLLNSNKKRKMMVLDVVKKSIGETIKFEELLLLLSSSLLVVKPSDNNNISASEVATTASSRQKSAKEQDAGLAVDFSWSSSLGDTKNEVDGPQLSGLTKKGVSFGGNCANSESYGSIRLSSPISIINQQQQQQQKRGHEQQQHWIVTFAKSEVAKMIDLTPVSALPPVQLLFFRWLLYDAQQQQQQQQKSNTKSNINSNNKNINISEQQERDHHDHHHQQLEAETKMKAKRDAFFSHSPSSSVPSTNCLPIPSLETLFVDPKLHPYVVVRKKRTFFFPTSSSSSSSASRSSTSGTIRVVPIDSSVFDALGSAHSFNTHDCIVVKIALTTTTATQEEHPFAVVEFLKEKLGLSPVSAVLNEIVVDGESVLVPEGLRKLLE